MPTSTKKALIVLLVVVGIIWILPLNAKILLTGILVGPIGMLASKIKSSGNVFGMDEKRYSPKDLVLHPWVIILTICAFWTFVP